MVVKHDHCRVHSSVYQDVKFGLKTPRPTLNIAAWSLREMREIRPTASFSNQTRSSIDRVDATSV